MEARASDEEEERGKGECTVGGSAGGRSASWTLPQCKLHSVRIRYHSNPGGGGVDRSGRCTLEMGPLGLKRTFALGLGTTWSVQCAHVA